MPDDISDLLDRWPHEHQAVQARIIEGEDGEPKLQVRLELGVLQMALDGRPDGQRPFGHLSALEYYEHRLNNPDEGADAGEDRPSGGGRRGRRDRGDARDGGEDEGEGESPDWASGLPGGGSGSMGGGSGAGSSGEKPTLTPEECRILREEAAQYYQRYVALLVLEDFERVVRDTSRNLRALDLCREYGQAEEDRTALERFRPYILMVRARAMASQAVKDGQHRAAVLALDEGLESIRATFAQSGQHHLFDRSSEAQLLRGMRDALVPKLPMSQASELRERLQRAVEQENYELAAILRDELKQLQDEPTGGVGGAGGPGPTSGGGPGGGPGGNSA